MAGFYTNLADRPLADVITRLTGDVVVTDEIEDLIVELKRAGAIDEKTMVQLLGRYLAEKKSACIPLASIKTPCS